MKSVYSYYRNQGLVFLRGLVNLDDWDGDLKSVRDAEDALRNDSDWYIQEHAKTSLGELVKRTEGMEKLLGNIGQTLGDLIALLKDMHTDDKNMECLQDLYVVSPQDDMARIENNKDRLLYDAYEWILHTNQYAAFTTWGESDRPSCRLLWIKGQAGTGKTMQAIDQALRCADNQHPSELCQCSTLFFLDGPGGIGKTFLRNILLAHVRKQGKVALAVAFTGIAATSLEGRTAHSTFKIPLKVYSDSTCNISKRSDLAELIRHTKLILWDEAVMVKRDVFEAVDRTFRDILDRDDVPFGGDFRQTLPVIPGVNRAEVVSSCLKNSTLWQHIRVLKLTENMRLRSSTLSDDDRERNRIFAQRLLSVGESTGDNNMIDWPSEHVVKNNTLQDLADLVYDGLNTGIHPESYFNDRAILAARNDVVINLNIQLIQRMPGQAVEKLSADNVVDPADASYYPVEVLNQISESGLPPHKLTLKESCPVMLLRNLDPRRGLCNGTRLQVKSISDHVLFCTCFDRRRAGPAAPADGIVLLPRISCRSSEDNSFVEFDRRQFPIRVCFAMTINKSQGQSLGRVGIYLDPEVFSHGQLYVALSKTTDPKKLWLADDGAAEDADGRGLIDGRVKNIVYDEVFVARLLSNMYKSLTGRGGLASPGKARYSNKLSSIRL